MPSPETYAEEHRRYLQSTHPNLLRQYEKSGDLAEHLSEVGESASQMEDTLLKQSLKETRDLPFLDQMRELASRREEALELVRHDRIYQPPPPSEDEERRRVHS